MHPQRASQGPFSGALRVACEARAAGFGDPLVLEDRSEGDVRNRVLVASADPAAAGLLQTLAAGGLASAGKAVAARAAEAGADPQLLSTLVSLQEALLIFPPGGVTWEEVCAAQEGTWPVDAPRLLTGLREGARGAAEHWNAMRSQVPDAVWAGR